MFNIINAYIMKNGTLKNAWRLLVMIGLWGMVSCQKELNEFPEEPTLPTADLTTRVNASVSGFVTNETNAPVEGAIVQFGSAQTTTDEYGFFSFNNTSVVKNAAIVSVNKPGYFPGIKTFIASEGSSAFFRLKLLPKSSAGTFSGSAGGSVTLPNNMQVTFPANAVINEATLAPYAGTVTVSMHWLNPTAADLSHTMPGDLRGINQAGALQRLETYGMVAVELRGSGGQLLQVAPGVKATLRFPLPASMQSAAPATIPLWYFDETIGLWKEEGSATKIGNTYVGEVSHFSFWNCDVPSNFVQFNCTIVDGDLVPISNVLVKVSLVSNPANFGVGWTNQDGYVSGAVPRNANLKLEVFTDLQCGTPAYSQTFTTTTLDVSLGNVVIPVTNTYLANVTGSVTDCSGAPVSNGYILMRNGSNYYRHNLTATGTYDFNTIICNPTEPVSFIAEDLGALQQSAPLNYTLQSGPNAIPSIQACGTNINQFFNYSVNGSNYSLIYPSDSLFMFTNPQVTPSRIEVHGYSPSTGGTTPPQNRNVSLHFAEAGIAVGSSQPMIMFYTNAINDTTNITTPILVNITEYGPIGGFLAGNFNGSLTGTAPASTVYNITGNFRVRRRQ